jgi:uncharacterized small protein (DUF1192 family)
MSNYRGLGLSFLEAPEGELPGPPRAYVYVKNSPTADFAPIEGRPIISEECVSFTEIEYQIDELKRELDSLKAEARRKFASAEKREREALGAALGISSPISVK